MKAVPLTRARHAGNFAAALRSKGIPTERYLEGSHLPVDLLEEIDGGSVLSALSMLDFAENVKPESRLSCQIEVSDELDGLVVRLPASQH